MLVHTQAQFVFETNANGELKHSWSWPMAGPTILGLDGKITHENIRPGCYDDYC